MSSISLGVTALVAIDSFAANIQRSVRAQSRELLGGDVSFTSRRQFSAGVDSLLDSLSHNGVEIARSVSFPSMGLAIRSGGTRLTQVRGVTANYPLYGTVTTEPAQAWRQLQTGPNAVVDPALLIALDAKLGDTLQLGIGEFMITGTIKDAPGTPGFAELLGPRAYIPIRYLAETQLLTFGSMGQYAAFGKINNNTAPSIFNRSFSKRLEKQQVRVSNVTRSEERTTESIDQLSDFIGIVGLIALLLGGIGVASGVRAFAASKISTVAILRCMGATSGQVLTMYVAQTALMGLIGAALGTVLGMLIQFALPQTLVGVLPVDVAVQVEPKAILTGLAAGCWTALIFALSPLLALRKVSPLQTLRRESDAAILQVRWSDTPRLTISVAIAASVFAIAYLRVGELRNAVIMTAAIGATIIVLLLAASLLSLIARKILRPGFPYTIRQGISNLYRPGNQTRSVVLALGFGAFLVSTLYFVQRRLLEQFDLAGKATDGNMIFFDVQENQEPGVDSVIRSHGYKVQQSTPVVQMRISSINGKPVFESDTETRNHSDGGRPAGWALHREYRSTFRNSMGSAEEIVAGKWLSGWKSGDTSEVSLESELAKELRVKVGSTITWDVQGVSIPTRITSLRSVTWARFEPNFFAVFPPATLSGAPKQYILTAMVPGQTQVAKLQRDVVASYPNVSAIDLSLVQNTVAKISSRVSTAIKFIALFSMAMGIPVLFSAVAATQRDRIRESQLLRTLGATREQIAQILAAEYVMLGVLGIATGIVLGWIGSWGIMRVVF